MRVLLGLVDQIDAWHQRFEGKPPNPMAGSSLAGDDAASDPFHVSHAVWLALSHAVDNLHAFRVLAVERSGSHYTVVTRPYGLWPNLRAAIENSASALYVLGPAKRDERVARRLRILLQDAREADKAAKLTTATDKSDFVSARVMRLESVAQVADRRSLDMAAIDTRDRLTYQAIVRDAAQYLGESESPDEAEVIWRLLSGLSHGAWWSTRAVTEFEEMFSDLEGHVATHLVTVPFVRVAGLCATACRWMESAFGLYDQRATSHL